MQKINPIKKNFHLFIFLALYFLSISFRIFKSPLPFYDWDEAIYMQVGKEMIEKLSIIPLWQGKYWLDKPPLVMLVYGLWQKITFFIQPEISARLLNLFLNILLFVLIYFFILKITKSKLTAFLTVFIASFTPLFIQKVYTVNMDVFLGMGWFGYFLFYPNFILSTLFLSLAIFSKSLLGFYPIFLNLGYFLFLFFLKKIDFNQLKKNIKILISQVFLFSIWYIFMFFKFGFDFYYQHIYESHFKRVTSSIEFHFGERIFYLIELFKQYQFLTFFSILGLFLVVYLFLNGKISLNRFFNYNLFLPWFLFLNLTKTKIFWYLYPVLPQFAFYFAFLAEKIYKKIRIKQIQIIFLVVVFLTIIYWGLFKNSFLNGQFSSYDKFYNFANFAKNNCQKIYFLPEAIHRQAVSQLEKMNLTITTTKWWGGHPALVYYTDNKIEFFYEKNLFLKKVKQKVENECFAYFKDENLNFNPNQVKLLKQFEDILVFR